MDKIDGTDPLDNILYISIPESFNEKIGDFEIDHSILLPVETNENKKEWDASDLSWEMIISAMLKILAYYPDHDDREYFKKFVLAVKPNIISDLTNSAVIKAQDKDFELAEEIFLALQGLDSANPILRLNLILFYEQRWEQAKSIEDKIMVDKYLTATEAGFKEMASEDNAPELLWYYMGFFYYKRGMFDISAKHYTSYAQMGKDPDKVEESERIANEINLMNLDDALFQEASQDIHNGREHDGIKKIEEFLKKNDEVWNGWFLLGWAKRKLSLFGEAKEAFLQALEKSKPNSEIFNELAICEMELLNLNSSMDYLNQALQLNPEDMKIVSNMGILNVKMGNHVESELFFKTALEIEPNDPVALQYLKFLNENK